MEASGQWPNVMSSFVSSPRSVYPVNQINTTTTQLTSGDLSIGERETTKSEIEKIEHEHKGRKNITKNAKKRCG
jgi:hypothetical protein